MGRIQPWFQFDPQYENAIIAGMDVVERGLFFSLRIYSWNNNGLPADELALKKIAKNACGISSYRFTKVWPGLQTKFLKISSSTFVYEPDEEKRLQVVDPLSKRKEAGKIAANARWSKQSRIEFTDVSDEPCDSHNRTPDRIAPSHTEPEPEPDIQTPIPPPPEKASPVVEAPDPAGGGGEVMKIIQNGNGMGTPEAEHREICRHCNQIGLPAPSPGLSSHIRAKFPGVPIAQVLQYLPRFDGQDGPGLWKGMSPEQLVAESERQKLPVPKKGVDLTFEIAEQNIRRRMTKA